MNNVQRSLSNHKIILVNAIELSTLMPNLGSGKFIFQSHFNIIKLTGKRFRCKGKYP